MIFGSNEFGGDRVFFIHKLENVYLQTEFRHNLRLFVSILDK